MTDRCRLGVDLGGTKIEAVILSPAGDVLARERVATPANDYEATLHAIVGLIRSVENAAGVRDLPLGIGTPGALCPQTGRLKNANSTCLNGQPLDADLARLLKRPLRLANDANCLAVSEASDGAGAGAQTVFAVILGTGVGGGVVHRGQLLSGPHAIAGEWGHNPLPWPAIEEVPGPVCWCGQSGCLETWLSGPGLAADHRQHSGEAISGEQIVAAAGRGYAAAELSLQRLESRLGRALAMVVNILDPDVIVLGGGLSRIDRLYENVPPVMAEYVFSASLETRLLPAVFGDSSGVRGAAWLWPAAA
ncbi:MAG: fructokinase [Salinisphaeraceae bacterium]|jgi:fructokinase|nr:fructokinase [Salinisphaeraceae bacterium]